MNTKSLPFLLISACMNMDMNSVETTTVPTVSYSALYVVNGGDASLSIINAESLEPTGTVSFKNAMYPHHIYASSDGSKLVVAVPGMDLSTGHGAASGGHGAASSMMMSYVLVLDAKTGRLLASRMLDEMNHNALFSPDGKEIWTSQMSMPGKVLILSADKLETKAEIEVGNMPAEITFATDGTKAFVANGMSASVSVIDVAARAVTKTISVGENPVGAWQGSNGVAYVDNEAGKSLTSIDTASLDVKTTYALGFTPGYAALSPDGQSVWVSNADAGSVVLKAVGADTTLAEIKTGKGAHAIAFSPDGSKAFVSNQGNDTVSVIDVASRAVIKNINVGQKPNGILYIGR